MDDKAYLGFFSLAFGLASYASYFWHIFKGRIKPHAFTWFVWGTLTGIAFAAITVAGGGPGAWIMAANSTLCFIVAGIAFWQRRVRYVVFDWLALGGGLLGAFLWWLTASPLAAVILLAVSDIVGFLPSFRKVYFFPQEEKPSPWLIGFFGYLLALLALDAFTLTTWLYPVTIALVDASFVVLMVVRQRQTAKT